MALAIAGVTLAGCTSSGHGAGSGGSTTITTTSAGSGPAASTTSTTVANNISLRKNVTIQACAKASTGWTASGTAVAASKSTTYTITVFFVTVPGDTVEGSGQTTVTVPGGKSASWSITGHFHPTGQMQCVLRGVG